MAVVADPPGGKPTAEPRTRERAATRLGAERRRVFVVSTLIGLAAPLAPYLTGAWETIWFDLAVQPLPFAARVVVFLLGVHVGLSLVVLPLAFYGGHVLPKAFGLSRQSPRAWAVDWLKGTLLGAILGTLIGCAFLWCVLSLGAAWWWAFGAMVSAVGLLLVFITPYVLVPLFFKMRPLDDTATVTRIQALVTRAGAPVRDVCSLDFSRRTGEANAAVIGIGRSRRVVLADTLLAEFAPAEVDAVVAHELGHHVEHHVQRLLLANAALVWLGLALAAWLAPVALPLLSLPNLGYVPAYPSVLFVAELFFLFASPILNWWSRRLETDADVFALRLTSDPGAFASAMQRLAQQNLAELRPPRWAEVLLGSHPALYRRIELARNWTP